MVLIDYWAGDGLTEKLQVPDGLALSTPEARLNQTWSDLGFGQVWSLVQLFLFDDFS